MQQRFTPAQVAEMFQTTAPTVCDWIREGLLSATNISRGNRPRFLISQEAIDEFEKARAVGAALPPKKKPRRRRKPATENLVGI